MERRATESGANSRAKTTGSKKTWPYPCTAASSLDGASQAPSLSGHQCPSSPMRRQKWVSLSKSIFPATLCLKILLKKMVL